MNSIKNRDRILEAIDQLRRRKARPDIQRICNYLFRRFSINSLEAKADLQWCVENDIVLKVEYKGSISYRNAAKKYSHISKRDGQQHENSIDSNKANRKFAQLLTNAFGELVVQEPDYLEDGVAAEEIIANILSKDSVRYTRKYISILIEKEVEHGGLIKMDNGKYLMGRTKEEGRRIDEADRGCDSNNPDFVIQVKPRKKPGPKPGLKREKFNEMDSDEKKSENGSLRVGGRRKRAKKVFDPSDTHVPKKRGRPAGSLNKSTIEKQLAKLSDESRPESRTSNSGSREQGGVCSVCHIQNRKGPNDRMVACRECSNKAHYSCLNGEDMMLKMYPDNTWQCPHCKTCVICYETSDAGDLVVCAVCADAYHAICHQPRISEKIRSDMRWLCINCEMPEELKINEIQSNISNAFSQKTSISNDNNSSSPSLSGNTTPNYQSPSVSPTPPQLSPQNEVRHHDEDASDSQSNRWSDDDNVDPSIPDATHWTAEEVYQYFAQYFPEEAHIFREQEIDGRSLLLLKRTDVLMNLKLKLGPALKIFRHVCKLQVRRDDPTLYWL